MQAPWARLLAFERRVLHDITRPVADSSQTDQSKFWKGAVGGGWFSTQASHNSFLLLSSLKKEVSKKRVQLPGAS
jgi:hypothetical protein